MASQNFSATGGETDCKTKFYQERFLTGAYERQEPVGPRAMRVSKKLPGTSQQRTLFPKKHLNMAPEIHFRHPPKSARYVPERI